MANIVQFVNRSLNICELTQSRNKTINIQFKSET